MKACSASTEPDCLMEMLREAYRSKADVREMIVKAGLII